MLVMRQPQAPRLVAGGVSGGSTVMALLLLLLELLLELLLDPIAGASWSVWLLEVPLLQ